MKKIIVIIIMFFVVFAGAQTESPGVVFNAPVLEKVTSGSYVKAKVSGVFNQPGKFLLDKEELYLFRDDKLFQLTQEQIQPEGFRNKKNKNTFELGFHLPIGVVSISLIFKPEVGGEQSYGLTYYVTKNEIKVEKSKTKINLISQAKNKKVVRFSEEAPKNSLDNESSKLNKNKISFGLGMNYLNYNQKYDQPFSSDLTYDSFKGPSLHLSYLRIFDDNWRASFVITNAVGSTTSGSQTSVNEGSYNWLIASLEGLYVHSKNSYGSYVMEFPLRFGLQYHIVPFIERIAASQVSVKENGMTFLSIGYGTEVKKRESNWSYETYIRAQIPIQSGSRFDVKSLLSFDGSVGVSRKIQDQWTAGLFWYGQLHNYKFESATDHLNNVSTGAGEQNLFFSNIELRSSYSW